MRYILFLIALVFLLSCNSGKSDEGYFYPKVVDSLHCKDLYDSAKWYLYTWNCDVLFKPKSDTSISKAYSELELKFADLLVRNDTLILGFNFVENGKVVLPGDTRDNGQVYSGVGFNFEKKEKIFMAVSNVYSSFKGDVRNRYVNPLQPEVIAFIIKNKDKLSPWFREEAKRRKII